MRKLARPDQPDFERIAGEIRAGSQSQLFRQPHPIGFDGFYAEAEAIRNLLVRVSFGDERENGLFSLAEKAFGVSGPAEFLAASVEQGFLYCAAG